MWWCTVRAMAASVAVAVGVGVPAAAQGRAEAGVRADVVVTDRAMWLWNRADPVAVVAWASANGVREIFAHVDPDLAASGDLPRLRELKRRADDAGIRLAALGGDPGWAFDHAAALAWQRTALGSGLFYRSHVDVEPYALAAWHSDQGATVRSFLTMLEKLRDDDVRAVEADVPFWYGEIPAAGGNLADEVLRRVDAVTVMSYRDTATGANAMVDVGTDMLVRGGAAGRPVRLAAETGAMPDCPHCTFYEEGRQQMAAVLAAVDAAASGYTSFAGIAVHHYGSWNSLPA